MKPVNIMGVPFSRLTLDETVSLLVDQIGQDNQPLFHLITANPEIVMVAQDNPLLQEVISRAGLVTPDGIGIVIASKIAGDPVHERVTGYDLLLRLLEEGNERQWSFFFVGADEETSLKAVETIQTRYPGLKVAGRHNGFFDEQAEARLVSEIEQAKPDLLIVALGAPKAEYWIHKHRSRFHAKLAMGVGGSLDVIAGKVKRAPLIWQKLNVEWLYRLLKQPSRWKRQLVLPKFALTFLFRRNR